MQTNDREGQYYYRIWDQALASAPFEFENPVGLSDMTLRCVRYRVLSKTPKGVWIEDSYEGRNRFVLNAASKRWAHPTVAEALYSYAKRKLREIAIMESRAESARHRLELVQGCIAGNLDYAALQFRAPYAYQLPVFDGKL